MNEIIFLGRNLALITLVASGIGATLGCETLSSTLAPSDEGVSSTTKLDHEVRIVQDFEAKRDQAEFQAAIFHFENGNFDDYENGMKKFLERNPHHREAVLHLAEHYIDVGQIKPASDLLTDQLRQSPDDPRAKLAMTLIDDTIEATVVAPPRRQASEDGDQGLTDPAGWAVISDDSLEADDVTAVIPIGATQE